MVRERDVERYLVDRVEAKGGLAIKLGGGASGVPDRLVLLPVPAKHKNIVRRYVKLVEVKRPGEEPRPLQVWVMEKIESTGHQALVVDSKAGADELLP